MRWHRTTPDIFAVGLAAVLVAARERVDCAVRSTGFPRGVPALPEERRLADLILPQL